MSADFGRVERLIDEIRALRSTNHELSVKNNACLIKIHGLEGQLSEALARADQLARDNASLLEEARLLTKRLKDKIKRLQIEMRRNDIFREVYRGSSKTKKEELVNAEIRRLSDTNKILLKFMQALEGRLGFDGDIAHELCAIATDADDPALRAFLDGIMKRTSCGAAGAEPQGNACLSKGRV